MIVRERARGAVPVNVCFILCRARPTGLPWSCAGGAARVRDRATTPATGSLGGVRVDTSYETQTDPVLASLLQEVARTASAVDLARSEVERHQGAGSYSELLALRTLQGAEAAHRAAVDSYGRQLERVERARAGGAAHAPARAAVPRRGVTGVA